MKRFLPAMAIALLAATPAQATGGFVCRTAGSRPVEVSLGFGHVPGSPLILTRLLDNGREIAARDAQWWLDNRELRLILVDPGATRREVVIRASRKRHVYDGSLWRNGWRHWVRCREG